jgi:hypothetical protein
MKNLKDYIHLYIGCLVQYPDTDGTLITAKLTGVTEGDGVETTYLEVQKHEHGETVGDLLAWKSNGNHNSDALHLKLVLRPLDSMTDDELKEWAILRGYKEFPNFKRHPLGFEFGDGGAMTFLSYMPPYGDRHTADQLLWFLSKRLDLFGLKEAGLAVYETDIKTDNGAHSFTEESDVGHYYEKAHTAEDDTTEEFTIAQQKCCDLLINELMQKWHMPIGQARDVGRDIYFRFIYNRKYESEVQELKSQIDAAGIASEKQKIKNLTTLLDRAHGYVDDVVLYNEIEKTLNKTAG